MKRSWLMGLASMLLLAACSAPAPDDAVDPEATPTAANFRAYSQAGGNAGVSNGLVAFNWTVADRDGDNVACGIDFENDGNTWASFDPQWDDFYQIEDDSENVEYGDPGWEIDYDNDGDPDPVDMAFRPFDYLEGEPFDGSLSQYWSEIDSDYWSYPYFFWNDNDDDSWAVHTHEGCTSYNMALALMNPGTYTAKLSVTDQPNPNSPTPYPTTTTRTVTYQVRNQAPVIRYFLVDRENNFGYNPLTFYWDAQDPNDPYARELYCDLDLDGNGSYEISNLCEYFHEDPFDIDDGDSDRWELCGSEEDSCWFGYGYDFPGYKKLGTFKPRLRVRDADGGVTTASITIGKMTPAQANLTPVIDDFWVDDDVFDRDYLVEEGPITLDFYVDIDQPSYPDNAAGSEQDEMDRVTCYLDPEGDGVFQYSVPDCWNASEGQEGEDSDPLFTHTYKTRGLYFPRIKVVDGRGGVVESILFDDDDRIEGLRADDFCRARYDADLDDYGYASGDIRAYTRMPLYCQGGNLYRSEDQGSLQQKYDELIMGWNSLTWIFPEDEDDYCYNDGIDRDDDCDDLRSGLAASVVSLSKPRQPAKNIPKGTGIGPVNFSGGIIVLNTQPQAEIVATTPAPQSGVIYLPKAPFQFKITHRVSDPDGDTVACAVFRGPVDLGYVASLSKGVIPAIPPTGGWAQYTSLGVCSQNGAASTRTSTYTLPTLDPDSLPFDWYGDNRFRAFDGLDAMFDEDDFFDGTSVSLDWSVLDDGAWPRGDDAYGDWQDFANPIVINGEDQILLPDFCQGSATDCD